MASDASFYDKNWTLLNKINGISDWLKENNIDIENWNWRQSWASNTPYDKFDVVDYEFLNDLGTAKIVQFYICINDYLGSTDTPNNDATNWKLLFGFSYPISSKLYKHYIQISVTSAANAYFVLYSSDPTPFTYSSFLATLPCNVQSGEIYTASPVGYHSPITVIMNVAGTMMVSYVKAGGASSGAYTFPSSAIFTDTVTEV